MLLRTQMHLVMLSIPVALRIRGFAKQWLCDPSMRLTKHTFPPSFPVLF